MTSTANRHGITRAVQSSSVTFAIFCFAEFSECLVLMFDWFVLFSLVAQNLEYTHSANGGTKDCLLAARTVKLDS